MSLLLFLAGLLAWTLLEYIGHRFIGHWEDRVCPHHTDPRDYNVGPSWAFVLLSLSLVALLSPLQFSAGFIVAYTAYAWLHYQMHHGRRCPRFLQRNHNIHHWHDDHANYGVSSPLWDIVFCTYKGK